MKPPVLSSIQPIVDQVNDYVAASPQSHGALIAELEDLASTIELHIMALQEEEDTE